MSKYLISTCENYRTDTQDEADEMIELARQNPLYDISKFSVKKKEIKEKKEVIGEYFMVSMTKIFENEKEPVAQTEIIYSNNTEF